MKFQRGILLLVSLLACLRLGTCRSFFRRYQHYNRFMKKMALNFEKAKVETLGAIFKRHVQQLRHTHNKQVELVFLIDSSGTVGRYYFYEELRFVKNLLADFTVDMNSTRVSVITFSSPHKIYRHIDYMTHPHMDNHKCRLLHEDIPDVTYTPGGTYTLGALLEAEKVLRSARPDATKAIFLMTDGYSNGGDPRLIARKLKAQGVTIFTFGIRDGFVWELQDMASHPKNETCYILDSFEEFEALAKRALHTDLQSGSHISQSVSKCGKLCNNGDKCCHDNATCTCGTYTGKYDCLCKPGFYGTGRGKTGCKSCPPGTYKNFTGQGGRSLCVPCPDENQITPPGAQSEKQCTCKRGYRSFGSKACTVARCEELTPPKFGYYINSKCNNVFNAACGLKCNSGYELHGSSLRICQEDGTWSGQAAKCIMKTCPSLHQPKNGHMICSTDDFSYSTVCRFTCNNGYQLVGSRKRTCLAIAFWTGIATRCREITCPPLVEIKDGAITPSSCLASEVVFGTVCQISCGSGYTLKGPHTKQCTPDGIWMASKKGPNQCIDETPPVLHCPDSIEIVADEEEDTTQLSWREPVPVDNSGLIPILSTEPAVTPGSRFPIGITQITYKAEDLSENIAECRFQIKVIDKTPPRVDRCPVVPQVISTGKKTAVTLEPPAFSDNSGKPVKVVASKKSNDLFPVGTTRVVYTAFDSSDNNSTCTVDVVVIPHLCMSPEPPKNGNISCEEGTSSVRCRISCMDGFTVISPVAEGYFCDYKTGDWMPREYFPFPDCAVVEASNDILQPATVTLTGDISCKDRKTLLEIAENLEEEMKEKLQLLCEDNGLSCSLSNLKSVCEDEESFNKIPVIVNKKRKKRDLSFYQRRRRRSVDDGRVEYLRYQRSAKSKRSKISFDITLTGSRSDTKQTKDVEAFLAKALKNLLSSFETQANTLLSNESKNMTIDTMSYDVDKAKYKCPDGSLLTDKTCIYCPVGTFHNPIRKLCEDCPKGTYQDKEGQTSCIRCPDDKSTKKLHSRSAKDCKALCKPGTFSSTGLEPCDTCHQGFYQSDYSAKTCFPCTDGKTTKRRGCSSEEKCAELCPPGHASKTGLAPCLPCPTTAYQPKSGQSECLLCPGQGSTGIRGAASLSSCIMAQDSWEIQSDGAADSSIQFNECDFENPCQNGGTCKEGEGTLFTCQCPDGYGGQTCKDVIDHCKRDPCLNNGLCLASEGSFTCTCLDGFTGATCDINVNDCARNQCQNEATCEDGVNSFTCKCKPGYTGKLCELMIDECEDDPCFNRGNCTMRPTGVLCQCEPGFTGPLCEVDMDECFGLPCYNDATCVDLPGDFRCDCKPGFTGKSCEVNIDECELYNPCENGGQCMDGVNGYKCDCPEGFDGVKCEDELTPYYQLDFINPSIMDYARLSIDRPLNAVTASLWIKTTDDDSQGTPFSYGVKGQPDAFTITDYRNLNVYINGEQRSTGLALTNGQWQHFVFTWSSVRGDWKVYVNGLLIDQGYDLSTSKAIPGKGVFIIGQEQDSEGGDFSAGETFVGSLTQLNIWDRELSLEDIEKLRFSCESFYGNVIAWPDVRTALQGDVTATPSKFCQDCPTPEAPSFGSVDHSGVRPNDDVTYSCQTGYITQGRATFKCLVSGEWENPPTRCRPITCSDPGPIRNGYITGADFRFNKRIRFFCNRGYELDGARSLLCTEYGDWDDDKPTCVAIKCNLPQLSMHTVPSVTEKSVSPGTAITFTCTIGHKLQTDHDSVLCQIDGSFDKSVPTCDPEKCYNPPVIPNADVIEPKSEYGVGEIVKYQCLFGYDFDPYAKKPIDSVNCLPSGDWETDLPICNEILCPEPPIVRRGLSEGDGRNVGAEVTYSCEPGYKGNGNNLVTCRGLGDWTRLTFRCRPVDCKEPPPVLFGTSVGTEYTFSSVVTYQCDQGYQRDGPEERKCQENGTWSQNDPFCLPIDCGKPPEISFGNVVAQSTMYSNKASYLCITGHVLKGSETLTCEVNGQWSPEPPTCEPRPCQAPEYVPFATYTSPQQLVYNTSVEYTCNTGYKMTGDPKRACTADGTWSPEAPVCEVVKCYFLHPPTSGSVDVDDLTYLSVARYSCDPDFKLLGVDTRTCQADGLWSDNVPSCKPTKCETPEPIDHMKIDYKDIAVGSIVRYSCEPGYKLVGASIRRCQENFFLSEEEPVCRPVECKKLDALKNGQIYLSQDDLKYGTSASFACEEGYILDGIEEITCIFDGNWSEDLPTCKPVECPKAGRVISNGRMLGSSFTYKSVIAYQCDEGYDMIGAPNRTCLSDGRWDNPVPSCQIIECPRPRLVYGSVSTFQRSFGTVVTFSCRGNYRLDGPRERTCMADGQWSGAEPRCLKINCDVPDPVDNAESTVVNETTVLYQCHKGFDLKGSALRICGDDEIWRPSPPTCIKSECEDLSDAEFANGRILFNSAKVGEFVIYECNKGYNLRGESRRKCLPSIKWEGDEPTCQIISCGHPGILVDGRVVGNDYTYNATVSFECNLGYQLGDVKSIRCLETGYWEDLYPFCEEQLCTQLDPTTAYGYVSVSSYRVGGEATYACDVGYRLEGKSVRVCQLDGEWSDSEPVCIEVKCPQPEPVEHGVMFGWKETYEYGDEVVYDCDTGYYVAGDNVRYCTEESKWTERIPECISVTCPELPFLENGQVDGESASFKAVITYGCNPGYELIGETESTCQADSTWSGDERFCTRISCGQPPSIEHAFLAKMDGIFFGDSAVYSCEVGYRPSGNDRITCQSDSNWSGTDFLCTIVSCPSVSQDDVPNAIFSPGTFNYGAIITFMCETGYTLSGPSALTCTPLGIWNDSYPECDIVICPTLSNLQFGTIFADSYEYGSLASFSCSIGYTLLGATDVSCLASGSWSDAMPVCEIVSCPEILASDFPDGRFRATSFNYGGSIDFGCNEGYIMTGPRTISCTSAGSWDADYPKCVIVTCPELGLLDFGTVVYQSLEYGSSANFSCNPGYSLIGSSEILCLASGFWSDNMPFCQIVSCPNISALDIPNGNFYGTSFTFTSLVNFTCNEGYRMSGLSSVECLATGAWSSGNPVCNIVTCPKLGSLEYGTVQSKSEDFGSIATFACDIGYSLIGSREITCLATGFWADAMPVCQINSCPDILASDFSNGNFTEGPFVYGNRADFRCNEGYRLTGYSSLECLANGRWDNSYPSCVIVVCPKLASLDFGTVFSLSDSYGSSTTFSCDTGYNLIGPEEIVCLASGEWSANIPVCKIVSCPEIYSTDIPNGSFQVTTFTFDNLVYFKCNEGYILSGSSSLRCTSGGLWNASYPICNIITCPTVEDLEFGTIFVDSLEYGSAATFSCNIGYSLIGYETISCLSTGVWSDIAPFCQIISCPDISVSDIPNGNVIGTSFTFTSLVNFTCNEGYRMSGLSSVECLATGVWSSRNPVCNIVTCPKLGSLEYGTVQSKSEDFGSIATFACDIGYSLIGYKEITCLATGLWGDVMPVCQLNSCPDILASDFSNGNFTEGPFVYGGRADFRCDEGYRLTGYSSLECLANGRWDNSYPSCVIVVCPKLASLDFGTVFSLSDSYGSSATFSCDTGYNLIGREEIICLASGEWSANIPVCKIVSCPEIYSTDIPNGSFQVTTFTFDNLVYFKCNEGYILSGSSSLRCTSGGLWNASYPTCNIITCPTIGDLKYGTVFAESLEYGSVATFTCNIGYSLIGYEKISCLSTGVWSDIAPFCQIISCPDILSSDIVNGYFNATEFTYGSLVYFSCNEGYISRASMTLTCTHTGSWNATYPLCTIVKCPDLPKLLSGTVLLESNEYGSTAGVVCDKGYNLRGSRSIVCLSSGTWNDSLPVCDIVSCGTPPMVENGQFEPQGLSVVYDNTAVYSCDFGYTMSGSNTLRCTEYRTFDTPPPVCSRIFCPDLDDIDFGRITRVNNTFVSFNCLPGFYLEGESTLECLLGGNWSTTPPSCLPIPCPAPPEIENGKHIGDVFSFGNYVTYKCEKGHELSGYPILVCQEDGNWSGDDIKCKPIDCGIPGALENGYIVGDVYTYRQTIEYFCNDGFEMKGKGNRTCRRDGSWSRKVPRCVRLSCTEPDPIPNGYFNGSDYRYESEIEYGCFKGYIIKGNASRRCESSLTWDGDEPICERAPCSSPPYLQNGFIEGDSFVFEDIINISCRIGYALVGASYRVCLADGRWSGEDAKCDEIFCSSPPKCDFCQILLPQDENQFRINTSAKYQCDKGYVLSGTDERICEPSGQWSDNIVECNPVPCQPIPPLQNGYISYNDPSNPFTYLSLAFFSCNQGFELMGSTFIECLATGKWSAQFPNCSVIECPSLQIDNGFTALLSGLSDSGIELGIERKPGKYVAGDIIRYNCDIGYEMNGPENSSCSLDAVWLSTTTYCSPVPCPLPNILNAFFSVSFAVFGDTITVICEKGLNLIGEDELTCGSNGTWREELPRCVLLTCGSPPFVDHSLLKGDSFQLGDMAAYECKRGYELLGNSLITCGPGNQWLGSPPVCVEVNCGIPEAIVNSIISYTSTTYKSTAFIVCDLGFLLQGREIVECGAERLWGYDPIVECVPRDCGLPPGIEHGTYDADDTTFGAVVFYRCNPGYFFTGSSSMHCDDYGNWGLDLPLCTPVQCAEPPTIDHGSVVANATFFSGVAVYTCDLGYSFSDEKVQSLACDEMGIWKGTIPECTIVECGAPPVMENSVFSLNDNRAQFLSIATYSCLPGHESEDRTVLTCLSSGLWEGVRYSCERRNCSDYPGLLNGEYSSMGDTLFGAQISYTCFVGHVKVGPDIITCQEDGQWSSRNHLCVPVDCLYPPPLDHATVTVENTTYKSLAQYSCDLGYHMDGHATIECLHSGLWSPFGQCKPVDCKHPPEIGHGNVSFTLTTFQSQALYTCGPGYSIGDSDSLVCGELGNWEGFIPTCDIVNCSNPNTISHGTLEYLGTSYLSEAHYACLSGYEIIGKDKISCLEDGTWSDVSPACHPLNCSHPEEIEHGVVTITGTTFGESAQYTCEVGYAMEGSPIAHCDEKGFWNTSAPICAPVDCKAPQKIENSILTFTSTTFGSHAVYECQEGFIMEGSASITCLENGKWSHGNEYRYCQIIDCFEPPYVENAERSYKDSLFGAIAVYNCLPGFTPDTENILICGQSGSWEGETFICSKVTCPQPPYVLNGDVVHGPVLSVGSQAKYTCRLGFFLIGNDVITCSSTGKWSAIPICAPVQCPQPPNFENAILASYDGTSFDSNALYHCPPGFRMLDEEGSIVQEISARCSDNGAWRFESSFYCELIKCSPFPPQIEHGRASTTGNNFSDLAEYTCDPGYRIEGDSVLMCDEDAKWSSITAPVCRIVSCGPPPEVLDSTFEGTEVVFGSTVTYHCHYGFKLFGSPTVQCLSDGRWSLSDIHCEAIECSLLPDLLNGDTHSEDENPHRMDASVTFTCHDGYLLNGPSTLTCLESGQWDNSFPICDKVIGVCLETVELEHGEIPPGKFPGDRVQIQCEKGYEGFGDMTSLCRNDGTWTMSDGFCRRVSCGRPETPDRRNVKVVGRSFLYGDQVVYLCRYGFTPLHRPPRLTCLSSGQWDGMPTCHAQCKTPCQNGGRCLGMNRCKCMPGWVGSRCQQPNCIFKCLHGGRCVAPYQCSCPPGYHGSRCQKPKCSLPCQNGGRCIAPNKCRCQGRFHGKQCELLRIGYQQTRT